MDKCIICQRVLDVVKPFLVELDDDPNYDFCERRWCADCADENTSFLHMVIRGDDDVGKIKCFLCVLGERKSQCIVRFCNS
jgi:hypothetical protein